MEFYAAERKKVELLPFATAWMELESIMLSEINQAVRDKYHMISPLTGTQFHFLNIKHCISWVLTNNGREKLPRNSLREAGPEFFKYSVKLYQSG